MKNLISKSLLLGTVSAVAFLSVQSSVFSATQRFDDNGQAFVVHRNPPQPRLEDFNEIPAPAFGRDDLAQVAHVPPQVAAKPADFAEWVEINQNDAAGAPVAVPTRSKASYILPIVSSTVVKPAARIVWSTLKGTYYAIPPVARAVCWTGGKTFEAAGNTLSYANDAGLFALDARRKLNAKRATSQEIAEDAGKRVGAATGNALKWLGSTIVEGAKGVVPSLWSGVKWTAQESWENTKAFIRDVREAYLNDAASAVWSSVKSAASRAWGRVSSFWK